MASWGGWRASVGGCSALRLRRFRLLSFEKRLQFTERSERSFTSRAAWDNLGFGVGRGQRGEAEALMLLLRAGRRPCCRGGGPGRQPCGRPGPMAILLLVKLPGARFAAGRRLARRWRSPFFRRLPFGARLDHGHATRCRSRSTESTQTVRYRRRRQFRTDCE